MSLVIYDAMMFARKAHEGQVRKYTGVPYFDHLAEVAGITASVCWMPQAQCVAWLHDTVEDCDVTAKEIEDQFGPEVAHGVLYLSDLDQGNRAERKRLSCERLARAPDWVQTIKCADLISNTSSIVAHDPKFAKVYLAEKRALLDAMTKADRRLWNIASDLCREVSPPQS